VRGEVLILFSFVLVTLSTYFQGSANGLSGFLLAVAVILLFAGIHLLSKSRRNNGSTIHLVFGALLPILFYINYGNPFYLLAIPFLLIPLLWRSEKAFLCLVPAGLILGVLAIQEKSYIATLVGSFLLAISIILAIASLYFWIQLR